jgi:beta-galactosidase/beta-glucuronidase
VIRASQQDGTHPRPGMLRDAFISLDGPAGFAFDPDDRGVAERWFDGRALPLTITLPFSPESPASGIGDTDFHRVVWYRIPVAERPAGDRLLLHFGAVDRVTDVWVDGTHVGRHEGGQTAFSFDITDAAGAAPVVVVRAEDDPHDPASPRGKQDWHEHPHSIWYHRITGIWRSVWLEGVPAMHVTAATWTPSSSRIAGTVTLSAPGATVTVTAALGDELLGRVTIDALTAAVDIDLALPVLRNGQAVDEYLWSPQHPRLIDLAVTVSVDGSVVDEVACYTGLRSVGIDQGRLLMNDRPLFLRSVLEQGYWPDSHFTPPSLDAIRDEVELMLRLGFNSVRIHQKVEDARLLYWCDRLGLTVWCEAASAYAFTPDAVSRYTADWIRIVQQHRSHPSVIAWVPFNESWGIQQVGSEPPQQAYSRGLSDLTRALDPTRPVISNDGWEHTASDIVTLHDYSSFDRYTIDLEQRGPHGRRLLLAQHDPGAPVMVTEFGGVRFGTDEGWGYTSEDSLEGFQQRLAQLFSALHAVPALAGFCYTQLTDTAQEMNGLCDERRRPKLPLEVVRAMVTG